MWTIADLSVAKTRPGCIPGSPARSSSGWGTSVWSRVLREEAGLFTIQGAGMCETSRRRSLAAAVRRVAAGVLCAAATAATTLLAQTDNQLGRRLNAVVMVNLPQSRVLPVTLPSERDFESQRWAYGDGTIAVLYFIKDTVELAQAAFSERMMIIPSAKTRLDGLGDEAYEASSATAQGRVYIRAGRVILEVSAPTHEMTRRLAVLFLDQVERSRALGELDRK